jgi:DNA-binding MarR family transcriptional regulator
MNAHSERLLIRPIGGEFQALNICLDNSRYNRYRLGMSQSSKVRHIGSPEEAAFLDMLSRGPVEVFKVEDLSPSQYNVLRILRGAPEGLPCGEIASRLITRDPDVTRLLDRMERRGLISRARESRDRRMVLARLTPEGRKLVDRLDEPVQRMHRKLLGHLGKEQLRALRELLAAARARAE